MMVVVDGDTVKTNDSTTKNTASVGDTEVSDDGPAHGRSSKESGASTKSG